MINTIQQLDFISQKINIKFDSMQDFYKYSKILNHILKEIKDLAWYQFDKIDI